MCNVQIPPTHPCVSGGFPILYRNALVHVHIGQRKQHVTYKSLLKPAYSDLRGGERPHRIQHWFQPQGGEDVAPTKPESISILRLKNGFQRSITQSLYIAASLVR